MDGCLLLAVSGHQVLASAGLDLDSGGFSHLELMGMGFDQFAGKEAQPWAETLLRRMVAAIEKLAVRFGLLTLEADCDARAAAQFMSLGYRRADAAGPCIGPDQDQRLAALLPPAVPLRLLRLQRSLRRQQTAYGRRIRDINAALGIPDDYPRTHRLGLQDEAPRLKSIGQDIYARPQSMAPAAARAWSQLCANAAADGVTLQAVSAFRPVSYQQALVLRKLAGGQSIGRVLEVSAAPGYSEHHSGRAIDVTTPGFAPLEEVFEKSPAFAWLQRQAAKHGFRLSFPRHNRNGICYEPWHWYFTA